MVSDDPKRFCPMHLSDADVARLRLLAANTDALLNLARTHNALLMLSHVAKWLSAILGALVLLKGFNGW